MAVLGFSLIFCQLGGLLASKIWWPNHVRSKLDTPKIGWFINRK